MAVSDAEEENFNDTTILSCAMDQPISDINKPDTHIPMNNSPDMQFQNILKPIQYQCSNSDISGASNIIDPNEKLLGGIFMQRH